MLIELQKGANSEEVSGAICRAVGDQLLVRPPLPTVTMKLRELEDGTTKGEVQEAVGAALGDVNPAQIEGKSLRKGPRGTQVALVLAPKAIASAKILKPGKVRVGFCESTREENGPKMIQVPRVRAHRYRVPQRRSHRKTVPPLRGAWPFSGNLQRARKMRPMRDSRQTT